MEECQITKAIPTVSEFLELRKSCGLSPRGVVASEVGLKNSWYSICVRRSCDQQLIGMGRIVGDGGDGLSTGRYRGASRSATKRNWEANHGTAADVS